MRVDWSFTKRASAIVAATMCSALALTSVPAEAQTTYTRAAAPKTQFGPVQGLAATVTKPAAAYQVKATWNVLSGAASYQVTMTNAAGGVVDQGRVSQNSWQGSTSLPATSRLTVKVVPLTATNRRGRAASTAVVLPDLTAPSGTFTAADDGKTGTVTQLALTDDVSAAANVVREINWGSGFVSWTTGDSVSFTFDNTGIYKPLVRLTDEAGNARTYELTLVIGDETAPQGEYVVTPSTVWAKLTKVQVTQLALSDDFSAAADIERWVNWNDGTAPMRWQTGTTLSHVYGIAGRFVPQIRLVDQAGNKLELSMSPVLAKADTAAPKVTVTVPARRVRDVATWRTVRGKATDIGGVGVANVTFRAVQRRGSVWYAYRAPVGRWVKAGATRQAAMRKSRPATIRPTAQGTWSHRFGVLRKGTLVVAVNGKDRVGNTSPRVFVRQRLIR